jgi:hypothetical protein
MKMRFSWETDRQAEWAADEEPVPEPSNQLPGFTRRRRLLFAILVQASLVIIVFGSLLVRRQQKLEQRIAGDVLASHRLLEQAVVAQDLELFTSFHSKEDSAWLKAQRELLLAGMITGRSAMGLSRQPAGAMPTVELSPDWRQAELNFEVHYLAGDLPGVARPVRLRHTAVYRYYRTQRWLRVPPDEAFWGETVTEQSTILSLEYPERDAALAQRLGHDLQEALHSVCDRQPTGAAACAGLHLTLRLATDPAVLVSMLEQEAPLHQGRAFVIPAFTVVGIPLNEESYQALYEGYAQPIMETVGNYLLAPLPLPEQVVQVLCRGRNGRARGLQPYQYDPWFDAWSPLRSAEVYNYLQPLPEGSGVVLRRGLPGTELYQIALALLRDEQVTPLAELLGNEERLVSLVGFAPGPKPELLVRMNDRSVANVGYQALNVDACAAGQCVWELMQGYPVWSPDGRNVLLADAGKIYRQDWREQPLEVGSGFNAFWLSAETYGFINLVKNRAGPAMQIVMASIHDDQPRILLTTDDLVKKLNRHPLSITYAAPDPADTKRLYLSVTNTGTDQDFFLVSFRIPPEAIETASEELTVQLQLDDLPSGEATLLTPTGFPPFAFSPGGRFLLLVQRTRSDDPTAVDLDSTAPAESEFWKLHLYDTHERETQTISLAHPAYPARFPFYDWSADGRWLIAADRGMLRLVAPEYGYERLIPHHFEACYHTGWTNIGE